jgi:hypothetical protein
VFRDTYVRFELRLASPALVQSPLPKGQLPRRGASGKRAGWVLDRGIWVSTSKGAGDGILPQIPKPDGRLSLADYYTKGGPLLPKGVK